MEFHVCTFEIKLQYVKSQGRNKWGSHPIKAVWKSAKKQTIVSSVGHHNFSNGTAWFNEIFEIKTDLLYDVRRKKYERLSVYLQIREANQNSGLQQTLAVDLGQVALQKVVPDKQYDIKTQNSLTVCLSKQCLNVQNVKDNISRKILKGERKQINKFGNIQFFLQKRKHVDKQNQNKSDQKIMQIPQSKKLETAIILGQGQGKNKDVIKKQEVEEPSQITEISNQLAQMQNKLQKLHNRNHKVKQQFQSISIQLAEAEKQCTILSAQLSQRETIIFDLNNEISALKDKNRQFVQKIVNLQSSLAVKQNLEDRVADLQKSVDNYKFNQMKLISNQIQLRKQLQEYKREIIVHNHTISLLKKQIQEIYTAKSVTEARLLAVQQQKSNMKKQVCTWRFQWSIENQKIKEQLSCCEGQYNKLFQKYNELVQKFRERSQTKISQQFFNSTVEEYKAKIAQLQQKSRIFKEQFKVIEQQIQNLHELLEEKEQNEQQLLEHIKKLQYDLETMQLQSQWWDQAICKQIKMVKQNQEKQENYQNREIMLKNRQLMQLLKQNSFVILDSEKIKRQLIRVQRQNEQLQKRKATMHDEIKQLRQKTTILLKQSKKLQDKNSKLAKQKQAINQKNTLLNSQLDNNLSSLKDRDDYIEALSFRLSQFQKQISSQKQQKQNRKVSEGKQSNNISNISVHSKQGITENNKNESKIYGNNELSNLYNMQMSKTSNQFQNQKNNKIIQVISSLNQTIEDRIIDSDYFQISFQKVRQLSPHKRFPHKINTQLQKIENTANKVKVYLLKSGLTQLFEEWQLNLQALKKQSDRVLIRQ